MTTASKTNLMKNWNRKQGNKDDVDGAIRVEKKIRPLWVTVILLGVETKHAKGFCYFLLLLYTALRTSVY